MVTGTPSCPASEPSAAMVQMSRWPLVSADAPVRDARAVRRPGGLKRLLVGRAAPVRIAVHNRESPEPKAEMFAGILERCGDTTIWPVW